MSRRVDCVALLYCLHCYTQQRFRQMLIQELEQNCQYILQLQPRASSSDGSPEAEKCARGGGYNNTCVWRRRGGSTGWWSSAATRRAAPDETPRSTRAFDSGSLGSRHAGKKAVLGHLALRGGSL